MPSKHDKCFGAIDPNAHADRLSGLRGGEVCRELRSIRRLKFKMVGKKRASAILTLPSPETRQNRLVGPAIAILKGFDTS